MSGEIEGDYRDLDAQRGEILLDQRVHLHAGGVAGVGEDGELDRVLGRVLKSGAD